MRRPEVEAEAQAATHEAIAATRDATAPIDFYRVRVPAQYNRTLAAQRDAARTDPESARVLAEMEAVRASIVVLMDGGHGGHGSERADCADGRSSSDSGDEVHAFAYDVERGRMIAVDAPSRAPFLVLRHAVAAFPALRRECGDSLLGFLGALAGLGQDLRITAQRVRSLRELAGGVVLDREGADGFSLTAWLGVAPDTSMPPVELPEPSARIRLDAGTYARLRTGALDPQDAFLAGSVPIEGDEGLAIGLALAALSPD